MSQTAIAHVGNGYRVYRTELGTDRTFVGPTWPTPREAVRYADLIAQPYVAPVPRATADAEPDPPRVAGRPLSPGSSDPSLGL